MMDLSHFSKTYTKITWLNCCKFNTFAHYSIAEVQLSYETHHSSDFTPLYKDSEIIYFASSVREKNIRKKDIYKAIPCLKNEY